MIFICKVLKFSFLDGGHFGGHFEFINPQIFEVETKIVFNLSKPTQSTVLPVPTRHRRHACIKMQTALPANTKTRPNVVSLLVQRRWRWANIETALGQIFAFAGLHTGVYTHPSATIIFSPADQGTFSKTAGQSQAYYNT